MLGNVVLWKPSPLAMLSNYLVLQVLHEAGLPKNVIQFIPGPPEKICEQTFKHPDFASLHFTGSTAVFKHLWKEIAQNIDTLKSYPRIVGETGGKNFHLLHHSADVQNAVLQSVRGAFEFQGQRSDLLLGIQLHDRESDRTKMLCSFSTLCAGITLARIQATSAE